MPQEKLKGRQIQVKEIGQQKIPQHINGVEKRDKYLKNVFEKFDLSLQRMEEQLTNSVYEELRCTITCQVTWREENFLFIDILCKETEPKYLDCSLIAADKNVQIRHQWKKHHSYPNLWEGAVAVFPNQLSCERATRKLKHFRCLNVVPMQAVVEALIDAEIHCPTYKLTSTGLIIKGKNPIPPRMRYQLLTELKRYGQISKIKFKPDISRGEICRVWFRFVSQAILANLILDQSTIFNVDVSVEVITSRKESHILGLMRNNLRHK